MKLNLITHIAVCINLIVITDCDITELIIIVAQP